MTQEEKAKAYDMALEAARKELGVDRKEWEVVQQVLHNIFPELRESEDENLKNKSGYYKAGKFWKASTLWNAVKGKSPQKVPNRYILQECTWNISSLQHFADEVKNVQEVNLDYPIILDMNGNILDGAHRVVKAYLEDKDIDIVYLGDDEWPEPDYDEEKAVKESEDERIRKALVWHLKADVDFVSNGVTKAECLAWLEKQKEQKPASTEDMPYVADEHFFEREPADSFKYRLAEYMTKNCKKGEGPYGYSYNISSETILEMAKEELIKRGELQKPVEWSEEDEKILDDLVDALGEKTSPNVCAWLKSLRPQWKPSEEQMKALDFAVTYLFSTKQNPTYLRDLYNDLKKLKED